MSYNVEVKCPSCPWGATLNVNKVPDQCPDCRAFVWDHVKACEPEFSAWLAAGKAKAETTAAPAERKIEVRTIEDGLFYVTQDPAINDESMSGYTRLEVAYERAACQCRKASKFNGELAPVDMTPNDVIALVSALLNNTSPRFESLRKAWGDAVRAVTRMSGRVIKEGG